MGSNDYNEVSMSTVEDAESSDTTVEIKIKTLDSQTYTLRVNKRVPVPELKEQIATVTGVLSGHQRLICRGTVLKDDQLLSAYHVEDGHTLHLVIRQPVPSSPSGGTTGSYAAFDNQAHNFPSSSNLNQGDPVDSSVVFEAANTFQGENIIPSLDRLRSILSSFAIGMAVSDFRGTISERIARPTANAVPANSAHPTPAPPMSEEIPDSLTTINQYIVSLRDQFRREALSVNGMEHNTNEDDRSVRGAVNGPDPPDGGLPNVAHLATIVQSTRELLTEQAAGCLSQLARRLEGQANVTDPLIRRNIQNSAIRFGVCIQNLGALLLELGRTTMALHMGQSPSEALVNSGPSVFISASGPNPLMVQPRPFHPGPTLSGVHITRLNFSRGLQGHAVPAGNGSLGEQAGGLQAQVQTDQARNVSGSNFFDQTFSGPTNSAPITGLSGARVVPVRRVIAVAAGVNRFPSDPSGNPVGVMLPVHLNPGLTEERSTQALTEPHPGSYNVDQLPLPDGNQLPANILGIPSGLDQSAREPLQYQGRICLVFIPRRQPTASNNADSAQADNRQQSREHAMPRSTFEQRIGGLTRGREANISVIDQPESLTSARVQANTSVNGNMQGSAGVFIPRPRPTASNNDDSAQADNRQQSREHAMPRSTFEQRIGGLTRGREANVSSIDQQEPLTSARGQANTSANGNIQGELSDIEYQGLFFSNLVRQLMPYISQGTTIGSGVSRENPSSSTAQAETDNSAGSNSSQEHHDHSDAPCAKRHKTD